MNNDPVIQEKKSFESSQPSDRALILHPVDCVDFESIVTIDCNESTLGSSEKCDVLLPFPEIAAHHVTILDCEDEWTLRANDKKTWINGNMVQISDLKQGDRLKIGTLEFEIELISQVDEETPATRWAAKKKSVPRKRTKKNTRKKKTGFSSTKTRSRGVDHKSNSSLNKIIASSFSELDNITHDEIAECLTILKALQEELENDTEEMSKLKQDLEEDREQLLAERENLTVERNQLRDGFAALTQAREAMKARENHLEEREHLFGQQSRPHADSDLSSLYRKSEEEKIHDLRSELADQFELELDGEKHASGKTDFCNLMPVFSDEELEELESTESLCEREGFIQNEKRQVGEVDSENKNEEVSVQEYMQNLLQRSRHGSPDDDARNSQVSDRIQESGKKTAHENPTELSKSEPVIVDESEIQAKHQIDKQSVRADLQSMRELANISARSAIAQHSTKRLKLSICLKLILTTSSFFLGVAILFLTSEGFHISAILQAGAVSIGTIALLELLRTITKAHRAFLSNSDQPSEDEDDETQNIEFEINDSAIFNNPDFITEEYRSEFLVSKNEFTTPSDTFGAEDGTEENDWNDLEEAQTDCDPCLSDQIEAISSKDVIMEIPVEPEYEDESSQ